MERISTAGLYNSVLSNLMAAQSNQVTAGNQVSSQKVATDLQGYGSSASTLTAMQSVQTQTSAFLDQSQVVATRLSTQDTALGEVAGAASDASQAITSALGSGSADSLMQTLQVAFGNAVGGLNTTFNGEYLFSGGQTSTPPVTATSLSDLTSAPSVASLFQNGQLVTTSKINQNTTINTGFLADQVGTPLFNAMQAIEAYNQGPNGPLTGTLTTAQTTFLQQQVSTLNTVSTSLTDVQAQNGQLQSQVTAAQTDLTNQQTSLSGLIGNMTDANLAQADVNLQQAQLAVQASAQVIETLKNSSLVNLLPVS
jgi:flagellar hook-associated protein 3 FlgL